MTFIKALQAAKDTPDAEAYISRIKTTVAKELEDLDGSAKIKDTQYFNHSAIPDFIVTWPKERGERHVFLRHSYDSVVAGEDGVMLGDGDPIVLTLETSGQSTRSDHSVKNQSEAAPRLLLTEPAALEIIGADDESSKSPLRDLVRANFVRGGKGHINQPRASELVQLENSDRSNVPKNSQESLIQESFFEEAAARITRTAQLIDIALGINESRQDNQALVGGKLSIAELRHLLPWLLDQPTATSNVDFWKYVGTLMTFADLESIRTELDGLNVSPLIAANSENWSAKRAYIGIAPSLEGEEFHRERLQYWSFQGGALGVDFGERRLLIANNGQLLKGRDGNSGASWDNVSEPLRGMRLARVDLRGVRRSVIVNAEQSPDIRADIEEVTRSLDDQYFVNEVAIRFLAPGESEGTTDVEVKFDKALVNATTGASLADLAKASLQVLNFRQPLTDEEVSAIVSTNPSSG